MLLQRTWKQVEPRDLRGVGVAIELSGLWFLGGEGVCELQWEHSGERKGTVGNVSQHVNFYRSAQVGMCLLTAASWAPESRRKSDILLDAADSKD